MNYNFPRAKFVDENNTPQQFSYICGELDEAEKTTNTEDYYIEVADAWHAMETFWRIVTEEKGEAFVQNTINKVIDKNEKRGYYERDVK